MRNDILEQAQEIRTSIDNVTVTMADADAAKNPMLFLPWETDTKYEVGDRRRHDGKLYMCQRTGEATGGTVVLQYMPHELVGHYFVEVS